MEETKYYREVKPKDFVLMARFTGDETFYTVTHFVMGYDVETAEAGAFDWSMIEEFRFVDPIPSPPVDREEAIKMVDEYFSNYLKDPSEGWRAMDIVDKLLSKGIIGNREVN